MGTAETKSTRVGRPRLLEGDSTLSPRGQILDAAAALFAELGFAATSTRAIADRVGIRQASIYYHFAGKDEILVELLTTSVRPSLDFVRQLEDLVPEGVSPAGALSALAQIDVETLLRTPHNIGTLYLLPEVQHDRYEQFQQTRAELQETYGRLGTAAASADVAGTLSSELLGAILIQLAEVVIQLRRAGQPADPDAIASSCLRAVGLREPAINAARTEAQRLLSEPGELTLPE
jgi:AcrR family transcriptional regulator